MKTATTQEAVPGIKGIYPTPNKVVIESKILSFKLNILKKFLWPGGLPKNNIPLKKG